MKTIKELEFEQKDVSKYCETHSHWDIFEAKIMILKDVIKLIDEMPLGNYNKQLDEFRIKLKARIEGK